MLGSIIGFYYTDTGVCNLYKCFKRNPVDVSNIYYYDLYKKQYYSPNMKNLETNGRTMNGYKKPAHYWSQFIIDSHDSMVR
jgi:hypothetical protein